MKLLLSCTLKLLLKRPQPSKIGGAETDALASFFATFFRASLWSLSSILSLSCSIICMHSHLLCWLLCYASFSASTLALSSPLFSDPLPPPKSFSRPSTKSALTTTKRAQLTTPVSDQNNNNNKNMERGVGGRIEDAFQAAKDRGEAAFVTFVTAGYPSAKGTSWLAACLIWIALKRKSSQHHHDARFRPHFLNLFIPPE